MSGFIGLVIEPDGATIHAAYELAATLLPEDAEQRLGPKSLPHVTLTQCAIAHLPLARLATFVETLSRRLIGRVLSLGPIVTFGGGFLFWCVDDDARERPTLQQAHDEAITLAEGFLDPGANGAVVEATRRLTGDDATLVANASRWGYAFVRERYLPHITLGFDPRLVSRDGDRSVPPRQHRHAMRIERVVAVRLGRYGRVEQVLGV